MISILTYISLAAGGLLILLLMLSIIGGLDLDMDVDFDGGDSDVDSGGLGIVKGGLAFIALSFWVIRVALISQQHPVVALGIGIVAGAIFVLILRALFKLFLSSQANVNWDPKDSLYKVAKVYLRIPPKEGTGIIQININGAMRELKAKTLAENEIPTGSNVLIEDFDFENEIAIVDLYEEENEIIN